MLCGQSATFRISTLGTGAKDREMVMQSLIKCGHGLRNLPEDMKHHVAPQWEHAGKLTIRKQGSLFKHATYELRSDKWH